MVCVGGSCVWGQLVGVGVWFRRCGNATLQTARGLSVSVSLWSVVCVWLSWRRLLHVVSVPVHLVRRCAFLVCLVRV